MLSLILKELEQAQGPLNMRELSRKLGVQPGALEGMLLQLLRMGKLELVQEGGDCGTCSGSCSGAQECPFVFRTPQRFQIKQPLTR